MIKAQILGSFRDMLRDETNELANRLTQAVADAGLSLRERLRQQIKGAGLGDRLQRTWSYKVYPNNRPSLGPAAFVYSKAPKIVRAFEDATVVKSPHGNFLAIPTEAAPKQGIGGKRIAPANWPDHLYGRLRFVYRTTGPSLLVVDNQRLRTGKTPGFRRATDKAIARGRGLSTVVMFLLVRQARMPKLLDVKRAQQEAERELIQRVKAAVGR